MNTETLTVTDALEFSIEMVPDVQFNEEETNRRRGLWQLWMMLPRQFRVAYPQVLAKVFDQPIAWVHEVLDLDADTAPA